MSCDGDTISITAADKPSIEDLVLGLIPGLPKVHLHNKVLSPTMGGEEFLAPFRAAAAGRAGAVHPGHRGFDPQPEHHRGRGLLDLVRQRPRHRAAVDRELVDRPAGPEGMGGDGGRHLRRLRRHPRHGGQPDRCHGVGRLPGTGTSSPPAGLPIVNIPGCPVRPENFMETLTWLLYHAAGTAPAPPLDGMLRPAVDVQHERARRL